TVSSQATTAYGVRRRCRVASCENRLDLPSIGQIVAPLVRRSALFCWQTRTGKGVCPMSRKYEYVSLSLERIVVNEWITYDPEKPESLTPAEIVQHIKQLHATIKGEESLVALHYWDMGRLAASLVDKEQQKNPAYTLKKCQEANFPEISRRTFFNYLKVYAT